LAFLKISSSWFEAKIYYRKFEFFRNPTSRKNEKIWKSLRLTRGKVLAIEMVLRGDRVADAKYVELLKSLISSRVKALNNKAIAQKKKKYLC
jgi:hypothetical protein